MGMTADGLGGRIRRFGVQVFPFGRFISKKRNKGYF